jgi:hypothetical protein
MTIELACCHKPAAVQVSLVQVEVAADLEIDLTHLKYSSSLH